MQHRAVEEALGTWRERPEHIDIVRAVVIVLEAPYLRIVAHGESTGDVVCVGIEPEQHVVRGDDAVRDRECSVLGSRVHASVFERDVGEAEGLGAGDLH